VVWGHAILSTPLHTKDNPAPFKDELERFMPSELKQRLLIHKDDGTACVLPYCKQEHDEYIVTYRQMSIEVVKVIKKSEIKEVRLGDNPFLLSLTDPGMSYQGYSADTMIKVAAREGDFEDWAAYFATPDTPFGNVVDLGNKLPEQTAKELFPEWAKRSLRWRR